MPRKMRHTAELSPGIVVSRGMSGLRRIRRRRAVQTQQAEAPQTAGATAEVPPGQPADAEAQTAVHDTPTAEQPTASAPAPPEGSAPPPPAGSDASKDREETTASTDVARTGEHVPSTDVVPIEVDTPRPPGADLGSVASAERPGFRERGQLRRRLRYLRRLRELGFRDVGGLVFDLDRFGRTRDDLVRAKLDALAAIDAELRNLELALDDVQPFHELREPGIAACPSCGALHASDARFCPACGTIVDRSDAAVTAAFAVGTTRVDLANANANGSAAPQNAGDATPVEGHAPAPDATPAEDAARGDDRAPDSLR